MDEMHEPTEDVLARALSGADLARARTWLAQRGAIVSYAPGQIVAFEGEATSGIGVVLRGSVAGVALCSASGREVHVSAASAGDIVHDLAWHDDGGTPLTLRAQAAPTILFVAGGAAVTRCVRDDPAFRLALLAAAAAARRALLARVRELSFYEVRSRVARCLLDAGPCAEQLKTVRLAALTGTVPDVAARTVRQFRRKGYLTLQNGALRILDRGALQRVAQTCGRPPRVLPFEDPARRAS